MLISRHYPNNQHERHPSKRAVIAGQGQLKDHSFDPLAMLRASIARFVPKTWVTTKKASVLEQMLWIYAGFHSLELIDQGS
ncbi:MAG: hypothetical protein ACK5QT_00900 [Oligoflexia bacterium]